MGGSASSGSSEQRRRALERANEVRIARAKLKGELRQGTLKAEQVLLRPPELAMGVQLVDLLLAVPKLGPARVARLLTAARVSQTKTVGGLSDRQRVKLAELLRG